MGDGGYVEFGTADPIDTTVTGNGSRTKAAGLTHQDTGGDLTDIRFGVVMQQDGEFHYVADFVEGGGLHHWQYADGDRFRLVVEAPPAESDAVVHYLRNGVEFWSATVPHSADLFPLWVDTSLRHVNSTITDVVLGGNLPENALPVAQPNGPYNHLLVGTLTNFSSSGSMDDDGVITSYLWTFGDGATAADPSPGHTYSTAGNYVVTLKVVDNLLGEKVAPTTAQVDPPNTAHDVTWAHHKRVTVSGSGMTKTSGTTWKAGGFSSDVIDTGLADGFVEYVVPRTDGEVVVGLARPGAPYGTSGIMAGIRLRANGQLVAIESGHVQGAAINYAVGDHLRITVHGLDVAYSRNGAAPFYQSTAKQSYGQQCAAVSIKTAGASVTSAQISGAYGPPNLIAPAEDPFDALTGEELDDPPDDDNGLVEY